jgi:glycosyltransferase involved in cell wall biosynthesis
MAGDGAPIADAANFVSLGRLGPGELARHMGEAAVFVSPARYEPFGLAVLEAALSGCALVLGDIATFRELWDGAAEFVEPDDADAIAAALERLLDDPAAAASAGAAARRRALGYGLAPMGRAYLDLYRELCGLGDGRASAGTAGLTGGVEAAP